ncbi:hypothetical protein A3Q56_07064 [Intoshia linei]|uniref:Thiamin pyrophosphokinase catalytic domain-containing protein n=1 Tax=Intoshia linei TaxID=1819745 RepID=A0A177AT91_9BILA|nr:hypothetical protein A3Q56_07064 [Intoshia linei]
MSFDKNIPIKSKCTIHPLAVLTSDYDIPFAVVLLNTPLKQQFLPIFINLWRRATFRSCVDGAINQFNQLNVKLLNLPIPDLITGDFDSATNTNLKKYQRLHTQVIKTEDQNYTDFEKHLNHLSQMLPSHIEVNIFLLSISHCELIYDGLQIEVIVNIILYIENYYKTNTRYSEVADYLILSNYLNGKYVTASQCLKRHWNVKLKPMKIIYTNKISERALAQMEIIRSTVRTDETLELKLLSKFN